MNKNPHLIRMTDNIRKVAGEEKAKEFEENYPLSQSANIQKKYEWAKKACEFLEENCDDDTIREIREGCICFDGKSVATKMIQYKDKTQDIAAFAKMFNEKESFATIEWISEHELLYCYPECYCSCVKRVPETLPKTWCYCTQGYAKALFRQVFGKEVEAELLESVKSGDSRCAVKIRW
ncbi:MAG TPA: DUF6144 family protein [Lachnospiraceae bacterium]|nr:DUF6144 family protein [Lachnospiraceae bacterium]